MAATGIGISHLGLKIIHNIEEATPYMFKDVTKFLLPESLANSIFLSKSPEQIVVTAPVTIAVGAPMSTGDGGASYQAVVHTHLTRT